jgi:acyl-CoA synthetase (NDP forming)/RimJ/RimL family protein N-acetyltransferase
MSLQRLSRIFKPRRIALIGASDQPDSIGAELTAQALTVPDLEVLLVNRRHTTVHGQPTLADVSALPDGLDLAVVMTPWETVSGIVKKLSAKQCAGVVVLSLAQEGGVLWDSSRLLLGRLKRQMARSPMRIIGPASQGLLLPRLGLNLSLCAKLPPPGHIAFVAASAAVTDFFTDWSATQGVGASLIVGLGDAVDLDAAQCLDYLAQDVQTRAVLLYLDRMPDPRNWLSAARALTMRKPLVVLIDPSFAAADGVAELDSLQLIKNALERVGALVVSDLEELCAAANVDLPAWPHAGRRFAILGNAPALAALAAQAVQRSGGCLARLERNTERLLRPLLQRGAVTNPIDLRRNADGARYAAAIAAVQADPGVDVILSVHHANAFAAGTEVAAALQPAAAGAPPLLSSFVGGTPRQVRAALAQRGIAAFATPESAVAAYALNRRYYQLRSRLRETPPALLEARSLDETAIARLCQSVLSVEERACMLLDALQIPLQVDPHTVLLWPAVGLVSDPRLGLLAWVAIDAEQRRSELLPLDRLRVVRLTEALENRVDPDLLAQIRRLLLLLGDATQVLPQLQAISVCGIARDGSGEMCARVDLQWRSDAPPPRYAFAPVPIGPLEVLSANDGRPMLLRPIRAEDEPRLAAGFTRLSPEEVRMRFMYPLKQLTHELAARLTQLDYDREIALVLSGFEPAGQAELYGVVRASLDVLERAAEFAIVIPRQLCGQGLGQLLMRRIIDLTHARGMQRIWGDVLAENSAMRALAAKLGFVERPAPDDDGVIRVELAL